MSKESRRAQKPILHCSFCGKPAGEVFLVTGPLVQICHECVELCVYILKEHNLHRIVEQQQEFVEGDGI